MKDTDFIAAMSQGIPPLPKPDGLEVTDCSGVIKGNADLKLSDLKLSDLERIEGICALSEEIRYG